MPAFTAGGNGRINVECAPPDAWCRGAKGRLGTGGGAKPWGPALTCLVQASAERAVCGQKWKFGVQEYEEWVDEFTEGLRLPS